VTTAEIRLKWQPRHLATCERMSVRFNVKSRGSGLWLQLHFFSFMRNCNSNQFVHSFRIGWLADDERFRAPLHQKV
jgi:hypothetical protein